jgi:membrane protease YdiL (CAAX protease family)
MPWDFWLILLFCGVFLPWRGRARMQHLMALPFVTGGERIKLYVSTILFQWTLTALVGWRALERGLSLQRLGITGGSGFSTVLLAAAGAVLIAVGHWTNLRRMAGANHPASEKLRAMATRLFPRSPRETVFYILLAVTAGICEEFIFRGFVIAAFFQAGLSAWSVIVLSSVMFGVAHLYQGKSGSVGTGILGALFALVRIAYHSLLPVVIWHTVLDIVAGLAGARYFTASPNQGAGLPGNR